MGTLVDRQPSWSMIVAAVKIKVPGGGEYCVIDVHKHSRSIFAIHTKFVFNCFQIVFLHNWESTFEKFHLESRFEKHQKILITVVEKVKAFFFFFTWKHYWEKVFYCKHGSVEIPFWKRKKKNFWVNTNKVFMISIILQVISIYYWNFLFTIIPTLCYNGL